MAVKSVNKFIDWYVETLPDETVDQALTVARDRFCAGEKRRRRTRDKDLQKDSEAPHASETAASANAGANANANANADTNASANANGNADGNAYEKRRLLKRLWRMEPQARRISAFFASRLQHVTSRLASMSISDITDDLDNLVREYGVPALAFALIMSSDEFRQEIGFDLVNTRVSEVVLPKDLSKPLEAQVANAGEPSTLGEVHASASLCDDAERIVACGGEDGQAGRDVGAPTSTCSQADGPAGFDPVRSPGSPSDALSDLPVDSPVDSPPDSPPEGPFDLVAAVNSICRRLGNADLDVDASALDEAIEALVAAWQQHKAAVSTRTCLLERVQRTLSSLSTEYASDLAYYEVAGHLPLDVERYRCLSNEQLSEADMALSDLEALLVESRALLASKPASFREDMDRMSRLGEIRQMVTTGVTRLSACFAQSPLQSGELKTAMSPGQERRTYEAKPTSLPGGGPETRRLDSPGTDWPGTDSAGPESPGPKSGAGAEASSGVRRPGEQGEGPEEGEGAGEGEGEEDEDKRACDRGKEEDEKVRPTPDKQGGLEGVRDQGGKESRGGRSCQDHLKKHGGHPVQVLEEPTGSGEARELEPLSEPAEPADSVEPTGLCEPTSPREPGEPAESGVPTRQTEPTEPPEPTHPTEPGEPEDPTRRGAPTQLRPTAEEEMLESKPVQPGPAGVLNELEDAVWRAIARADFGTAYWLVREVQDAARARVAGVALEGKLVEPRQATRVVGRVPPSWAILACLLARETDWARPTTIDALYRICLKHSRPLAELAAAMQVSRREAALFIVAIALRPTIFAPTTGIRDWLQDAESETGSADDPVGALVRIVLEFTSRGEPLDIAVLNEALADVDWDSRAAETSRRIRAWRDAAGTSQLIFATATNVIKYLAGPKSSLASALDVAAGNDHSRSDVVRKALQKLLANRKDMEGLVKEACEAVRGNRARIGRPQGSALEQIVRKLDDVRALLIEWLDAVSRRATNTRPASHVRRVSALYGELLKCLKELTSHYLRAPHGGAVSEWLAWKTGASTDAPWPAGPSHVTAELVIRKLLCEACNEMIATLENRSRESSAGSTPSSFQGPQGTWERALLRPLLLINDPPIESLMGVVSLDEEGEVELGGMFLPSEPFKAVVLGGRTLREAFDRHLSTYDFVAADEVLREMRHMGAQDGETLEERLRARRTEARVLLAQALRRTRAALEQATIDHVLSEADRSTLDARLLSIEEQRSDRVGQVLADLGRIEETLSILRRERYSSLRAQVENLAEEFQVASASSEGTPSETVTGFIEKARAALDRGDLPLADEYLHFAEVSMSTGVDVKFEHPISDGRVVEQFVQVHDELSRAIEEAESRREPTAVMDSLAQRRSVAGLDMREIPGARGREIRRGLEAYRTLKIHGRPSCDPWFARNVEQVLEYMGFRSPSTRVEATDKNSAHLVVETSAGGLSPLADFGSDRHGEYHVVVVYGRPSASTMGQLLHYYQVTSARPIIIYMARLTLRQRKEWSEYCRMHATTAMLVDELLLYFLASQRDNRLPAAVKCGVAWGYAVPYHSSGLIPPELFKGRQAMIHDIGEPRGSCIVYGGRQFGKSVLLKMVEREYDRPDQGSYVWYQDIKLLGHPQGYLRPADLWPRLRDWLVSRGLLQRGVGDAPETLVQRIAEVLKDESAVRILILLDEADNFLAADAGSNYEEVERLRRLMEQTDYRFKVVFCGLHGVQRYCSHSNHPFAQLRAPVVVGPLEPQAARELVVEPLSALGFSFSEENTDTILRILSYTNYHPALIQFFCEELLKLVRQRSDAPPYRVTMNDVEAVYRRDDVRRMMRERFVWTIDLDCRYQVIVYAMVLEQLNDRDGYRREFSTSEVFELASYYWKEAFESLSVDDISAFLEELIGLGVLVKSDKGAYRLRNGNVVRALGSEQEIWERLGQIVSQSPPAQFDPTVLRINLGSTEGIWSPLTVRQASELVRPATGVSLVFGSDALGLSKVPHTLKLVVRSAASDRWSRVVCEETPPECVTAEQLAAYLTRLARDVRHGRVVTCSWASRLLAGRQQLTDVVATIARVVAKQRSRSRSLRWTLLFDPPAMRHWWNASRGAPGDVEARVDSLVVITRWDPRMVERFLSNAERLSTPPVVSKVLEVTGGWPWLMEHLWRFIQEEAAATRGLPDPTPAAEKLDEALRNDIGGLRTAFRTALAVDEIPHGPALVRLLHDLGPVPAEDLPVAVSAADDDSLKIDVDLGLDSRALTSSVETLVRMGIVERTTDGLKVEPVAARVIVSV